MAGETFFIKQNDTAPVIQEQLFLGDAIIDLTGCTIKFSMKATGGSVKVNRGAAAIVGAEVNGTVQYEWIATDTDTIGAYQREWEITFPNTKVMTIPNDVIGYVVTITDDIA
jgi:hypothetical protein